MFLKKYINDFYYNQVLKNYNLNFLENLDELKFLKVFVILKKFNCYFIEDIILKYLELFTLDSDEVYLGLNSLKNKLGDNFMYKIGMNMTYLNEIIN